MICRAVRSYLQKKQCSPRLRRLTGGITKGGVFFKNAALRANLFSEALFTNLSVGWGQGREFERIRASRPCFFLRREKNGKNSVNYLLRKG